MMATAVVFARGFRPIISPAFASITSVESRTSVSKPKEPFASVTANPKEKFAEIEEVSKYRFVRMLSSRKTATKLLGFVAVIAPILGIGGAVFGKVTQQPLKESIYEAYTILVNMPGADGVNLEQPAAAKVVASGLYVCHLVLFATLLGIVIDDFSIYVNDLRSGNYNVCESGHTVILNWNDQLSPSLLRQLAVARAEQGTAALMKPVVIVADKDPAEMDAVVCDVLSDGLQLEVMTRHGLPYVVDDLQKVAAGQASRVIVLFPHETSVAEADCKVAATMAALNHLGGGQRSGQSVVVQVGMAESERPFTQAANSLMTGSKDSCVLTFNVYQRLQRVMAQSAVSPGMGAVLESVLQQSTDSAEFYIKPVPAYLVGLPYSEVRRCGPNSVIVGYERTPGEPVLNPAEDDILQEGDKIVVMCNTGHVKFVAPQDTAATTKGWAGLEGKRTGQHVAAKPFGSSNGKVKLQKNVVALGWQPPTTFATTAEAIADFSPPGSSVTVIGEKQPEDFKKKVGGVNFKFVASDCMDVDNWSHVICDDVDSIILGPAIADQNNLSDDTDAQVIANILNLQDVYRCKGCQTPLHVVSCMLTPANREVARWLVSEGNKNGIHMSLDLLLPNEMAAGMLTQVAAQPEVIGVIREIASLHTTVGGDLGAEIVLHRPQLYGIPLDQPITFAEVAEIVRSKGDTPIGFIQGDGSVRTAPEDAEEINLGQNSKIVVISSDYQTAIREEAAIASKASK